jgi:hypothetical protein
VPMSEPEKVVVSGHQTGTSAATMIQMPSKLPGLDVTFARQRLQQQSTSTSHAQAEATDLQRVNARSPAPAGNASDALPTFTASGAAPQVQEMVASDVTAANIVAGLSAELDALLMEVEQVGQPVLHKGCGSAMHAGSEDIELNVWSRGCRQSCQLAVPTSARAVAALSAHLATIQDAIAQSYLCLGLLGPCFVQELLPFLGTRPQQPSGPELQPQQKQEQPHHFDAASSASRGSALPATRSSASAAATTSAPSSARTLPAAKGLSLLELTQRPASGRLTARSGSKGVAAAVAAPAGSADATADTAETSAALVARGKDVGEGAVVVAASAGDRAQRRRQIWRKSVEPSPALPKNTYFKAKGGNSVAKFMGVSCWPAVCAVVVRFAWWW